MGLWEVVKLGAQVNDFCLRFGEVCFIVLFKLYQGGLRVLELSWATSLIHSFFFIRNKFIRNLAWEIEKS